VFWAPFEPLAHLSLRIPRKLGSDFARSWARISRLGQGMDTADENGICKGGISDRLEPLIDRQLAGHDG